MRTLFHYHLCPFSRKVRLALAEKNLDFTPQQEPIWKKREEFLDLNPMGQVPVLIDDDFVISESQAIVEYLDEKYTEGTSLVPKNIAERAETRRLCNFIDGKFYFDVTHKIVFERTLKRLLSQGGPDSKIIREGNKNISTHLEYFSWLIEKRHWLAGSELSMADLALAAHISCLDYVGYIQWSAFPAVKEWYTRLKSRPSFQPLLADTVAGIVVASHYRELDF